MANQLTIVVPTYNESNNIEPFVDAVKRVLSDINWEIIFVDDDSPDGTSTLIRELANKDSRIRCIQRIKRRGLSSACIEGVLASSSPYICIMDVDLQHDESKIPEMYSLAIDEGLDLVIGSRYVDSGSTGTLPGYRRLISLTATRVSQIVLRVKISDPMSGFFMFRRDYFESVMHKLSGKGFKILLDILFSSKEPPKMKEVPYTMRSRLRGESKLGFLVVWDFFMQVMYRLLGMIFPYRFMSYVAVGFSGLVVHMLSLWILHSILSFGFTTSQTVATFIAMTSNYIFNNIFTYYDSKQTGKYFWRGLLTFYMVCLFGAVLNIALATELYNRNFTWFISGVFGAIAGAIWNFTVSRFLIWQIPGRFKIKTGA